MEIAETSILSLMIGFAAAHIEISSIGIKNLKCVQLELEHLDIHYDMLVLVIQVFEFDDKCVWWQLVSMWGGNLV